MIRSIIPAPVSLFARLKNKIFVRTLCITSSSLYILIGRTFYYLAAFKCLITTVCDNATYQFTFFLVIRYNNGTIYNSSSSYYSSKA